MKYRTLKISYLLLFFLFASSNSSNSDGIYIDRFNDVLKWIIEPSFYKGNSTTCRQHLEERPNIVEMIDSSSKLQPGILHGNYIDLGNFDECLQIAYKSNSSDVIIGKYCLLQFKINPNFLNEIVSGNYEVADKTQTRKSPDVRAGFAACMPESCSQNDIEGAIEYLEENNITSQGIRVTCVSGVREPFSMAEWIASGIFLVIIVMMILSTLYDLQIIKNGEKRNELLTSFSVYKNGNQLLTIKPTSQSRNISCLYGLRAISMAWVIVYHRAVKIVIGPLVNSEDYYEWKTQIHSTYIAAAPFAVDSFLVMSGCLVCYNFLRERDWSKSFNIIPFYIKRYMRLTPVLIAILITTLSLEKHFGSGPIFESKYKFEYEHCSQNWWTIPLYIQNYSSVGKMCMMISWYVAVDMQLFILSPLILIPLWKRPKYAIIVIVILLFAAVGIIFGILIYSHLTYGPIIRDYSPNKMKNFKMDLHNKIYFPTYTRYGPWLAGILLGYIIYKTRTSLKNINNKLAATIWMTVLIMMILIIIGCYPYHWWDNERFSLEALVFFSVSRILLAFCVCWIIYTCHRGQGGIINWFLSWGFWQPISRLSYCMYLLHTSLQLMTQHYRTPSYFSDANILYLFIGDYACAFLAAIVWSLAFEQPFLIIVKEIFKKKKRNLAIENMEIPAKQSEGHTLS